MKKVYYLECDSEYACADYLKQDTDELGYWGWYDTRKSGHEALIECKNKAKKQFADRIAREKKNGNTITIDLWACEVEDNFDTEEYSIWSVDERQLIESRYLCGRY